MRGSLLICEALLVFRGVLVITFVISIGMTFQLKIGMVWQLDLEGLLDWRFDLEERTASDAQTQIGS